MRTLIRHLVVLAAGATVLGAVLLGPLSPSQAADECTVDSSGNCTITQVIGVGVLPAGTDVVPTNPNDPGTTDKPPASGNKGTGKNNVDGRLAKTGPRETAIMALVGFGILQLGVILTVRSARSVPRRARTRTALA